MSQCPVCLSQTLGHFAFIEYQDQFRVSKVFVSKVSVELLPCTFKDLQNLISDKNVKKGDLKKSWNSPLK